jgi:hypothetical protein
VRNNFPTMKKNEWPEIGSNSSGMDFHSRQPQAYHARDGAGGNFASAQV